MVQFSSIGRGCTRPKYSDIVLTVSTMFTRRIVLYMLNLFRLSRERIGQDSTTARGEGTTEHSHADFQLRNAFGCPVTIVRVCVFFLPQEVKMTTVNRTLRLRIRNNSKMTEENAFNKCSQIQIDSASALCNYLHSGRTRAGAGGEAVARRGFRES